VDDPPSKDCTLSLVIDEPMSDPIIHKAFPGGIADLREYVYELHGHKDEWVKNVNDPNDTRWEYTYHGRLTRYGAWKHIPESNINSEIGCWTNGHQNGDLKNSDGTQTYRCGINQIDWVIEKLSKQPYTRQAQMITWMPSWDTYCYDPPCLQSIFFRLIEDNSSYTLNTNIRFRSNDAWGASFMNMFGLMQLIKTISVKLGDKMQSVINIGRLNWQADSYHIYGKDLKNVKNQLIDKIESNQPFEKRVWNFYDESIQEIYKECENNILEKIKQTELDFVNK
jgi:thymidylate synthase